MLSKLKKCNKEDCVEALSRFSDKPRVEYCQGQHGTFFTFVQVPLNWKEHTIHAGRRIESKEHETSLFLLTSESTRNIIKTADDRLDRTSS